MPHRRQFLLAIAAVGLAAQRAAPQDAVPLPADIVLGRVDAPVTVIEYHSLTCGNCANFHTEMLPAIKARLIDTGRVRIILRDFPLDRVALDAATMAHCAGPALYPGLIGELYRTKEEWAHASDPLAAMLRVGRLAGMTRDRFEACKARPGFVDAIVNQRLAGEREHKVSGTPSFVVGGKTYSGVQTPEQFEALVRPLLPRT